MTYEEELKRLEDDLNHTESEAECVEDEMTTIEREDPEDFEDREDWNDLHTEFNDLVNHAQYLQHCIEDLRENS